MIGAIGAMVKTFLMIADRSGSADHIYEIGYGATDQYTFGQLLLDINPTRRGTLMLPFVPNEADDKGSVAEKGILFHRFLRQHVATAVLSIAHEL